MLKSCCMLLNFRSLLMLTYLVGIFSVNPLLAEASSDSTRSAPFHTLAGNLPSTIPYQPQPYVVTTDIYVPSGKTVRIEPGVVLLFRNFTGLKVEGQLLAEGTLARPILFTSENDQQQNPWSKLLANPYDWNGIVFTESSLGSVLSRCTVRYSVYGINALTRFVKFSDMTIRENGRADVTIEGVRQSVDPSGAFSHVLSIDDAKKAGIAVRALIDPQAKRRNGFRYGGLGVFAVGCGLVAWFASSWATENQNLTEIGDPIVIDQNSSLVKNTIADYEASESRRNRNVALTIVGAGVGILGGIGFTWSFTF